MFTLQTIAFLANLQGSKNCRGPFLIVCPLSILQNWQNEFTRYAVQTVPIFYTFHT